MGLELVDVIAAIRRHGKALRAAKELHCSDAYIHRRLKHAGLTLREVLDAADVDQLLAQASLATERRQE